jgi:hypothetical protein
LFQNPESGPQPLNLPLHAAISSLQGERILNFLCRPIIVEIASGLLGSARRPRRQHVPRHPSSESPEKEAARKEKEKEKEQIIPFWGLTSRVGTDA